VSTAPRPKPRAPTWRAPKRGSSYYSNGRYGFRGGGANGQWEVGRAAPVNCTGS
jgi:hypothetical protein